MIPYTVHTHLCETILIQLLEECRKNQKTLSLGPAVVAIIHADTEEEAEKIIQERYGDRIRNRRWRDGSLPA